MRAQVYDHGPPTCFESRRSLPRPAPDQVLVRVAATSVNPSDWECLVGRPAYARIGGLRAPARRTLGSDIAGRVEAVGSGVTNLRVGDEVFGDNLRLEGGFAQ
jgi:NADPH:quinone reductase-like Zn-dependent oxidoreductase